MADVELVIRIPESLYNFVRSKTSAGNSRNFDDYDMYDVSRRIANGKPIDRMTNGEVIRALFPNSRVDISCARAFFYIREDLKRFVTFDINWWNEPYKGE